MSKQKIEVLEQVKKQYVRMALETGNYSSIARKAGIARNTLRKWIKEYEDEIQELIEDENTPILSDNPTKDEYKKRYEQAMILLGEKELEVAMLKNLLKKSHSL